MPLRLPDYSTRKGGVGQIQPLPSLEATEKQQVEKNRKSPSVIGNSPITMRKKGGPSVDTENNRSPSN